MALSESDIYIAKMKGAGFHNISIAKKLGISEAEVDARWKRILAETENTRNCGSMELIAQFTVLAHQYQLLGESLKLVAGALSNQLADDDLMALIVADPNETFQNLKKNCILLHPYIAANPEEMLKQSGIGN